MWRWAKFTPRKENLFRPQGTLSEHLKLLHCASLSHWRTAHVQLLERFRILPQCVRHHAFLCLQVFAGTLSPW